MPRVFVGLKNRKTLALVIVERAKRAFLGVLAKSKLMQEARKR